MSGVPAWLPVALVAWGVLSIPAGILLGLAMREDCRCAVEPAPVRVLILPTCGHRRWVEAAPMDAAQRTAEKAKPCPECPR